MVSSTVGRAVVGSAPLGVLWNAMSGDDGSAVAERARLHFRPATSRKTFQLHIAMLVLLLCTYRLNIYIIFSVAKYLH
jgi:hypothetical protein